METSQCKDLWLPHREWDLALVKTMIMNMPVISWSPTMYLALSMYLTSATVVPSLLLKFYSILLFPLLSSFILTPSWGILDLYLDLTTYFINQVVSLLWVIECAIYNFAKATGINQYYLGKLGCRIPLSVTRPQFRQVKVVSEGHLKKWF